jgi:hypothetical protein
VADLAAAGRAEQERAEPGRRPGRLQADQLAGPRRARRLDRGAGRSREGKRDPGALPTLPTGTGVVWLPAATSSKPPPSRRRSRSTARGRRSAASARARELKPLDLDKLKGRSPSIEEEAKANDPRALKAKSRRLTRELAKAEGEGRPAEAGDRSRERGRYSRPRARKATPRHSRGQAGGSRRKLGGGGFGPASLRRHAPAARRPRHSESSAHPRQLAGPASAS